MSLFSSWITSILGIAIVGVAVDLLGENSRVKGYLKWVLSTAVILVIIMPLPTILSKGIEAEWADVAGDITIDENFVAREEAKKLKLLEKAISFALEKDGISGAMVTVKGKTENNRYEIEKVTVDLRNSVIKTNETNINKNEFIRERVRAFLSKEVETTIIG